MNNKIVLLTGNNRFFGQTRRPWTPINLDKFKEYINEFGFEIDERNFHEVANSPNPPRNSYIFYTFSQKENLRHYLTDIVRYLELLGNILIPKYDLLLCHENKGYQELLKKSIGIKSLYAYYLSNYKEHKEYGLNYPIVLKTVDGTNAKGVFLVNNNKQFEKRLQQVNPKLSVFSKIDLIRREYLRRKKAYPGYPEYATKTDLEQYRDFIQPETRYVLQEFVPNLSFDYRVVVLNNKFFPMKRLTNDNDFRASGTKNFLFSDEVPHDLLDYANSIYLQLNTPFISLDIGETKDGFCLFEFQALHFGISSIILSKGYYQLSGDIYKFVHKQPDFERFLAEGLTSYIKKQRQ